MFNNNDFFKEGTYLTKQLILSYVPQLDTHHHMYMYLAI